MEDVGLITREAMDRAYKLRRTELRARALVDSAVAHSMRNRGEPDPRDFQEYAAEIATLAATLLLDHVYEDDAELNRLKVERDHYKRIAEESLHLGSPQPLTITQTAIAAATGTAET